MRSGYRRLGEAVERVGERLREDENGKPLVFRDSLIENIRELVDVVPRLNIFADDDLAMLCREVKDKFAGIEPDALRPSGRFDPNLRRQVKRDADALTAQFAGYFAPAAADRGRSATRSSRSKRSTGSSPVVACRRTLAVPSRRPGRALTSGNRAPPTHRLRSTGLSCAPAAPGPRTTARAPAPG